VAGSLIGELARVVVRGVSRGQATKQDEEREGGTNENGDLAEDGLVGTELGPLAVGLANVAFKLVNAKLVVDHAAEGNGVSEELQGGNLGAPDHHGGNDQEDILEHAAKSEDNSGRLADLFGRN
jgi:hypothetical protein